MTVVKAQPIQAVLSFGLTVVKHDHTISRCKNKHDV